MRIITLTTDFGLNDWFVGTMKGVIAGINPRATVVDLTHGIPSGDIRAGAFALATSYRFFPRGTVHVAVVDPGVGGDREAIAVQTRDYVFIGPDNGLLSFALRHETIRTIRRLENKRYFLQPISTTFHGRDIFAPVAAHLSKGLASQSLGGALAALHRLPWPQPIGRQDGIHGEVIYVDRFGNAITSIENELLSSWQTEAIVIRGKPVAPVRRFYQAVAKGKAAGLPGSSGYLEIAVSGGNAARQLKLNVGTKVLVRQP